MGHAYTILEGSVSSVERSKYAVLHMGPSVLAAAFTTICSAALMIFTVITFFQKFAIILFYTIFIATWGSIIVFITLIMCFGPSEPTKLIDSIIASLKKCCCTRDKQ